MNNLSWNNIRMDISLFNGWYIFFTTPAIRWRWKWMVSVRNRNTVLVLGYHLPMLEY